MRKSKDSVSICPVCEKKTCNDADECRIEWEADREQDFKDFVADMEEALVEAQIRDNVVEVKI